jgi:hypothetical protein
LHKKLQTDSNRIQRDIAEHAELSQQVMQLTKIARFVILERQVLRSDVRLPRRFRRALLFVQG